MKEVFINGQRYKIMPWQGQDEMLPCPIQTPCPIWNEVEPVQKEELTEWKEIKPVQIDVEQGIQPYTEPKSEAIETEYRKRDEILYYLRKEYKLTRGQRLNRKITRFVDKYIL